MTNCTTNILFKKISLTADEFSNIKQHIASVDWGILLESAATGSCDSRWSIYSAQPLAEMQTNNGNSEIRGIKHAYQRDADPLMLIESLRKSLFHQEEHNLLPFSGGVLGSFSYELGYQFETIDNSDKPAGLALPQIAVGFYDWALVYDNHEKQFYLVIHKIKGQAQTAEDLWSRRFNWLIELSKTNKSNPAFQLSSNWSANMDKTAYQNKFEKVQNYILSGDCYQVNLAQRFQASYSGDEYQAYLALFEQNRPPFAAFLRLPAQVILSLSPERFFKLKNNIVESKPIKGTRPRFDDKTQDDQSSQALAASPKDRAENLMIVDLLRNDIGRVCQPGSVTVPKLFEIESFPAVHHLVSTVLGRLQTNHSAEDLLRAGFPGGSITGAPKIRAMEIIAELEPNHRQLYCGSIGYINANGQMDSSIAIRTLVCFRNSIYCWAGGGLVADSNVDEEYQECFDKISKILPCLERLNK
ncbi:aminodeoxychorismate synthase component I [Psychromonas ossibalaenae]|uniref:aminodeoxychorismate synthase component I n=1 Tax=Psychromonas ossibalaenae TaxID=444922 RepID=UPI0004758448|nr:aminodeoxychorismate synthase component I [Psychromonas ossibalaenae]